MKLFFRITFFALMTLSAFSPAADHIQKAVDHPERSEKDRERDQRDKPVEVLTFVGAQAGWTVADIFSGSGYYTEILSHVVGPKGTVIAQNNKSYQEYGKEGAAARFTPGRLTNVNHLVSEADDLKLGKNTLDMAVFVMAYHDLYWVNDKGTWPKIDADHFLKQLHDAVKPGGLMVVIDHAAKAGSGNKDSQKLHRIEAAFAKQDFTKAGFTFKKASDLLHRTDDDHSTFVYDPAIRGKTDRFILVFEKKG